ncbi:MAG TPA: putative protein N(5)-glutamine methyltransferase [Jiangellaceae bacterium]
MTSRSTVVETLRAAGCVFAEEEAQLLMSAARTPAELAAMVHRRTAGLPVEHVVGWAEFCGMHIAVEPGVFIPRRRSELLVSQAVSLAPLGAVVVDLCCGSGAVGAALRAALDGVELYAVDLDPAAVRCALRNLGTSAQVYEGDLYGPLSGSLRGRVDLVVANAPYVPTDEVDLMPAESRMHEPHVALDGGSDGLDVVRRVISGAGDWLAPGGHLLVEVSYRQSGKTVDAMARHGLVPRVANSDELNATVVVGHQPSSRESIGLPTADE